jgi:hypothetical protein
VASTVKGSKDGECVAVWCSDKMRGMSNRKYEGEEYGRMKEWVKEEKVEVEVKLWK